MKEEQKVVPLTRDDFIFMQLRDLKDSIKDLHVEIKETRRELNARMDKLENRVERLEDKLDDVKKEMRSTVRHGQIMVGTVIAIALGVLYFIATH